MKIVINKCYGGFGLSPKAIKMWAERKGRKCYFFEQRDKEGKINFNVYNPITLEEAEKDFVPSVFDIPNPNKILKRKKPWEKMTEKEHKEYNDLYKKHSIYEKDIDRTDIDLVAVVEELGEAANGSCAKLSIIEIPQNVEYEIEEYDGIEHIAEKHRTWH